MARFNESSKGTNKTTNYEGGEAYKLTPELKLYTRVCTSMLQSTFYEKSVSAQLAKLRDLIGKVDPLFVAQLAVYAREQMHLRSIPLVLAVELAKIHSGDNLVRRMLNRVIARPDEITEALAYYSLANNRRGIKKLGKLQHQFKKGVGDAFNKFDEYQLAKYNREGVVTLKDAVKLTHPKPGNEKQSQLIKKVLEGNLDTPETWEVKMSQAGQKRASKKETWEEMINSNKMGYMAMLRNLRNFLKEDVSKECIDKVCAKISDPREVRKSKQLPFRFLSAYRALVGSPRTRQWGMINDDGMPDHPYRQKIVKALEKAVKISAQNMPLLDGSVLIASDVSGSMIQQISENSSVYQYDIGILMGMMAAERAENLTYGMFGSTWKPFALPSGDVLANVSAMYEKANSVGLSTNGYKVLQWANEQVRKSPLRYYERIMIFTDCQLYGGSIQKEWAKYKKVVPFAKLYLFDLRGYGTSPLNLKDKDITLIGGFSDKVFNIIEAIETGGDVLDEIKAIDV